jgi:hypothetical protein
MYNKMLEISTAAGETLVYFETSVTVDLEKVES